MFTRKSATDVSNPGLGPTPMSTEPPRVAQPFAAPPTIGATSALPPKEANARLAPPNEEGLVVIGKGTRVVGRISDCRKLDVHGILEADVVADLLVVRDGGGIKGTARTDHAEIHGVFEGTLVVHEHLDLQKTAAVTGEISYLTLSIQTGAKMRGNIVCHEPEPEPQRAPEPMADVIQLNGSHHIGANGIESGAFSSPIITTESRFDRIT